MKVGALSARTGVPISTLRRWTAAGFIPNAYKHKVDGKWLYRRTRGELDAWILRIRKTRIERRDRAASEGRKRKIISEAKRLGLNRRESRESVRCGRIVRDAELTQQRENLRGIFTPRKVRALFVRTIRDIRTRLPGPVEAWPKATRDAWKSELGPITELYRKL